MKTVNHGTPYKQKLLEKKCHLPAPVSKVFANCPKRILSISFRLISVLFILILDTVDNVKIGKTS